MGPLATNILFTFIVFYFSISAQSYNNYNATTFCITPSYICSFSDNVSNNNSWISINYTPLNGNLLSHSRFASSPPQPTLEYMSKTELNAYFAAQQWTEDKILSQYQLYMSDAYIELVKSYQSYPTYIKKYYEKYLEYGIARKCWKWIIGTYKAGMAQRFKKLYQDQIQQEAQRAYHNQLNNIESTLITKDTPYYYPRLGALHATYCNDMRVQQKIPVSEDVQHFAKAYEIEQSMLERGFMNPYEYQLHTEFIDQLNIAVQLQAMPNRCREHQLFLDAIGYGVALGLEANHNHETATATHWADYGWKLLDIAQAIGEGVALGCYNLAMIPVQVASGAMYCATHLTESLKALDYFFSCQYHIDIAKAGMDWLEKRNHQTDLELELENVLECIDDTIAHCTEQLGKIPLREKVKHITAFGTEIFLPMKFFKAGKILCTRMRPMVRTALQVIQDERIAVEVAGTAGENILMKVSEGIQEAETMTEAVEKIHDASKMVVPEPKINKIIRPLIPTWVDTQGLVKKFEGWVVVNGKSVHIDYEHLFSIGEKSVIKRSGHICKPSLYGWHHDYGRRLEKLGIVAYENIVEGVCVYFQADPVVNGTLYKAKTFFSPLWTEEKVIGKIFEVFEKEVANGLQNPNKNGCYTIIGKITEGLDIQIIFDSKKSLITTAFPLVKGVLV